MTRASDTPLAARVKAGDLRAIARAISLIEDEAPGAATLVSALHPASGRAYLVGVTGPPGAGKSTLVDRIAAALRAEGRRVGIVAVDPTSPFSGGAILGDRVRMQAHAGDPGVFIRSMATRGHLGGLARATTDALVVLDAAGYDVIVIETVGVGQDEVEIVRTADVSVVVLVPGAGDEVQALKAGVMEIADVFVINKADREGADRAAAAVEGMLALDEGSDGGWRPPILKTVATSGEGVPEVLAALERFRHETAPVSGARRRRRSEFRVREALAAQFMSRAEGAIASAEWNALVEAVAERRLDPYEAASQVMRRVLAAGDGPVGPGERP